MNKYTEKINLYKEEMIEEIKNLVSINSILKEANVSDNHPFGEGVSDGFKQLEKLAKKFGFRYENFNNMVCEISTGEKSDEYIGIIAHFDVVPVNRDQWLKDPFKPWDDGKFIYGRGTQDDKGPLIASLYAMKIIKDLGIPLKHEVRLIVGGNEETAHMGINEYFKVNPWPKYAFTPDSGFPLTNVEKGSSHGTTIIEKPEEIIDIKGGAVVNAVPLHASVTIRAKVRDVEMYEHYLSANNLTGTAKTNGTTTTYKLQGKTAHGSIPEEGVNALSHLLYYIGKFEPNKLSNFVSDIFHLKFNGQALGLRIDSHEAEKVGQTTGGINVIETRGDKLELSHDFRYPSKIKSEALIKSLQDEYKKYFENPIFEWEKLSQPLYIPEDSFLTKTLLNSYNKVMKTNSKPEISGGGTYAKDVKNCLAFGMMFPDTESTMHAPNEKLPIKDLLKGTEIYINAIIDLANSK